MKLSILVMVALLGMIGNSYAQDGSRGQGLYKTCVQCHGSQGEGNLEKSAPKIGGQHEWYVYSSLKMFKAGERKNPDMQPFIANLSDQDFKDLAAYVSRL